MRLRICLLTEIKRYKSAIRIRIGEFSTCVNGSDDSSKQVDAEFVVIKGTGQALLGCKTAQELGLEHITKPCDVVNAIYGTTSQKNVRIASKVLGN